MWYCAHIQQNGEPFLVLLCFVLCRWHWKCYHWPKSSRFEFICMTTCCRRPFKQNLKWACPLLYTNHIFTRPHCIRWELGDDLYQASVVHGRASDPVNHWGLPSVKQGSNTNYSMTVLAVNRFSDADTISTKCKDRILFAEIEEKSVNSKRKWKIQLCLIKALV